MSSDKCIEVAKECIETLVEALDYIEAIVGGDESETLEYLDEKLKELDKRVNELTT